MIVGISLNEYLKRFAVKNEKEAPASFSTKLTHMGAAKGIFLSTKTMHSTLYTSCTFPAPYNLATLHLLIVLLLFQQV